MEAEKLAACYVLQFHGLLGYFSVAGVFYDSVTSSISEACDVGSTSSTRVGTELVIIWL